MTLELRLESVDRLKEQHIAELKTSLERVIIKGGFEVKTAIDEMLTERSVLLQLEVEGANKESLVNLANTLTSQNYYINVDGKETKLIVFDADVI